MNTIIVTSGSTDGIAQEMYQIFYNGYREIHRAKEPGKRLRTNWEYKTLDEQTEFLSAIGERYRERFSYSYVNVEVDYFDTPNDDREQLNKLIVSYE